MSQIETLSLQCPIDFSISSSPTHSDSHRFPYYDNLLIDRDHAVSSPSRFHTLTEASVDYVDDDVIFPNLPRLFRGHLEVHLRNGVMKAARLSAAHEPDAERAFFVADLGKVFMQHQRWQKCLPEIQPFYAVKCNPDPYVLRLLAALGTGFDCASNGEICKVLKLGDVEPSRIIFANPCKASSFIRSAAKAGVDLMTFDNADELYKIARIFPAAKLVVRILTDDSKSQCALGIKYGASLATVPDLLAKARELGLNVVGVSFHVGSGCYDPSLYSDAVIRARTVFDFGRDAGYIFSLLDIGGGFEDATFEKSASVLMDAIDAYFPDRRNIQLIAEPGRFYVAKAFSLATNIIARRAPLSHTTTESETDVDGQKIMYYINDGLYGAFNCILFDHQTVHPYVLSLNGSFYVSPLEPMQTSSIWGPTCDSVDCVCPTVRLPSALRVGDWLAFDNMGAYTMCAASHFNGFEQSQVTYTSGEIAGSEVRRVLAEYALHGYGLIPE